MSTLTERQVTYGGLLLELHGMGRASDKSMNEAAILSEIRQALRKEEQERLRTKWSKMDWDKQIGPDGDDVRSSWVKGICM